MKTNEEIAELQNICIDLKKNVISMIHTAQSGHPGGSLSVAEFVTACYFREMNVDPKNPKWEDRDRFVLSKGHVCPAQYAALAMRGFFPIDTLRTLRKEGSILQGHPDMKKCPGIDISTGSLGQGLACGVGMAIAAKRDHRDYRVYVAVGDGECQDGTCDEVMPNIDLGKKFGAFGFDTYEIDGNDMAQMVAALDLARVVKNGKPKCIFGHTVKGKGVSYMENQCGWHGIAPNDEEYRLAMEELNRQYVKC